MTVLARLATRRVGSSLLIAAAVGLSLAAVSAASAQPIGRYDESPEVSGLTVEARPYVRQPETGARVLPDRVSLFVPIGDLDLSTRWGAHEAKARIEDAAREACDRVDELNPGDEDVPGGCYNVAVRNGLAQAEQAAGYPIVAWGYR